jgi:hypothetical protein
MVGGGNISQKKSIDAQNKKKIKKKKRVVFKKVYKPKSPHPFSPCF